MAATPRNDPPGEGRDDSGEVLVIWLGMPHQQCRPGHMRLENIWVGAPHQEGRLGHMRLENIWFGAPHQKGRLGHMRPENV